MMKAIIIIFFTILYTCQSQTKQLLTKDSNCYKIKCLTNQQMPIKCAQRSDFNMEIHLNSNICKSKQHCRIDKKYSGTCKSRVFFQQIKPLYPGQQCNQKWHFYQCGYASKVCSGGVCQGIPTGGQCSVSGDCLPTDYCLAGVCHAKKAVGQACTSKYECGRDAFCYYNVATNSGVCTAHFSIPSSDTTTFVLPKINNKVLADYVDPDARLLCQSGYADPTSGLCSQGPKSLKIGQSCTANSDCTSSVSGVTAECKCTWGSLGLKVCSALEGDTPYVQARAAFKEYYNATQQCHLAARWEQCGESKAYHNWKCKELKAKYYAEVLYMDDVKSCMDKLSQDLVIFDEIDYHCSRV